MLKLIDLIVNKIKRRNKWIAMDFWFQEEDISWIKIKDGTMKWYFFNYF